MEIRTGWESKVAGICQPWLYCSWNGNTHSLIVESGGNMSAMIVTLIKWMNIPTESQKWRGHVSCNCVAHEIEIRTTWDAKVAGTCQSWFCCSWNGNTHWLKVESGARNMSAMIIVPLMKWKRALSDSRKWQEHVSHDCAAHEMEIRTHWESEVTGTCQPWLCCSWNGNTHNLRRKSGENISVIILLLMKWKYALAESWKWREPVSSDY